MNTQESISTIKAQAITEAILNSKIPRWYNLTDITPRESYSPEELKDITYILINPDDQDWVPGNETEIPAEAQEFFAGDLLINGKSYPVYVY